jgi:hypothetical protein
MILLVVKLRGGGDIQGKVPTSNSENYDLDLGILERCEDNTRGREDEREREREKEREREREIERQRERARERDLTD